jgi:DNA-binding NarL/FixJ family response regulator
LVAKHPGLVLTRCVAAPADVLAHCRKLIPCVLVADQGFVEAIDPAEFTSLIDFGRSIQVLVELQQEDRETTEKLLRLGCVGVFSKASSVAAVARAVAAVASGELWVSRKIVSRLLRAFLLHERCKLTPRETEILCLISEGLKNHEIARRLFISSQTVRWHLRSLYSKLGVHDRLSAELHALGMLAQRAGGTRSRTALAAAAERAAV